MDVSGNQSKTFQDFPGYWLRSPSAKLATLQLLWGVVRHLRQLLTSRSPAGHISRAAV